MHSLGSGLQEALERHYNRRTSPADHAKTLLTNDFLHGPVLDLCGKSHIPRRRDFTPLRPSPAWKRCRISDDQEQN